MLQAWRDLLFLHWRWDPGELKSRLPHGIELDTFEGQSWLGLVPFRIEGVRPRRVPRWLCFGFPELNVPGRALFPIHRPSRSPRSSAGRASPLPDEHAELNQGSVWPLVLDAFAPPRREPDSMLSSRGVDVQIGSLERLPASWRSHDRKAPAFRRS